jgi:uncharacterized protein GlcG (DUF336 family)
VAVLDAGGHLKAFQREDGASMMRFEIASGKAYGAIALWRRVALAQRPGRNPAAFPGRPLGGFRWQDRRGSRRRAGTRTPPRAIIGAVGVTGDTSDHDEIAAIAGIEAAGFTPDAG